MEDAGWGGGFICGCNEEGEVEGWRRGGGEGIVGEGDVEEWGGSVGDGGLCGHFVFGCQLVGGVVICSFGAVRGD